jgi:hypothetical protein
MTKACIHLHGYHLKLVFTVKILKCKKIHGLSLDIPNIHELSMDLKKSQDYPWILIFVIEISH